MVSPERIYDLKPGSGDHNFPRLTVQWQPRHKVFFGNLRDLFFPRPKQRLVTSSAPGIFWKDVFVHRPVALRFILDSYALHVLVVLVVYLVFSSSLFLNHRLPVRDPYAHTTIEYYAVSEYLPPIRSVPKTPIHAVKGAPTYSKQEIISVPPEPDNSQQTIVTPDLKVISRDVPLPNLMVWADQPNPIQPLSATADLNPHPKLFTPPDIVAPPPEVVPRSRRDLHLEQSVIKPPPENLPGSRRKIPALEANVLRPVPDLSGATRARVIPRMDPSVIEPPPTAESLRRLPGEMNIGKLTPAVSSPKIAVPEQSAAVASTGTTGNATGSAQSKPSAPAPPSAQGLGSTRGSGQLLALSTQPAPVLGPFEIPRGSRRGLFAAGPAGTLGAPGTPTLADGGNSPPGVVNDSHPSAGSGNGPEGIYVGPGPSAPANNAVVVVAPQPAAPKPEPTLRERLLAAMHSASAEVSRTPAPSTPPKPTGDTKIEDKVFGEKKYYSMVLNMPNLNSSAGSWIVRFAELYPTKEQSGLSAPIALNKVDPAYPAELIRDKVEGTVVLYAVIRASGVVDSVRVLQSVDDQLDQSAISALRHWRFRPGTKHGTPVDIEAVVQIPFRLARLKH